ncbi:hypothetical protein [Salmonirosea aquatica]|uniref:Uncharacterized protein n=1 Tax=Salmonirosea aquatica TaxID=2654236 RepID=A0A7C9FZH1_9BACT|nr:hypothetical protein [Cytophagaceae bacterium SJW1-29]
MNSSLVATSSGKYGPVVALRVNNTELVPNSIGLTPSVVRQSEGTLPPGTYDILVSVQYSNQPVHACKLVLVGKGREFAVTDAGFFLFDQIVVNSSDEPLIMQVQNP